MVTITKFEPSEYLDNQKMIAEYIQVMYEENGITGLQVALGEIAKAKGMSDIAEKTHLSRASLYKSLAEDGSPKLETIDKVLHSLGLKLSIEAA